MSFLTDRQTLEDLNLLGRFKKDSIVNIFDRTVTRYGRTRLEAMFQNPMTDADEINRRSSGFRFFSRFGLKLPITGRQVEDIEFYLHAHSSHNPLVTAGKVILYRIRQLFATDKTYEKFVEGMSALSKAITDSEAFLKALPQDGNPIASSVSRFSGIFTDRTIESIRRKCDRPSVTNVISLDCLFRKSLMKGIEDLLDTLYDLDVSIAVANVAAEKGYGFAEASSDGQKHMAIEGVWHPSLTKAVPNDVTIDYWHNVFFLTGVNMAGKSTFMKAVATALYLAHMGFPVPAKEMSFTPVDGIYTSINVPDNIALGYSHFYAEVLRVKHIAEVIRSGKSLFVIFDELFKGTNVKDAYDATLAVTEAFANHRDCLYIISTHIVEVGEDLKARCGNVLFRYLPAGLDGDKPVYTYKLEEGISSDRHGMTIIRNEKIIDIIKGNVENS